MNNVSFKSIISILFVWMLSLHMGLAAACTCNASQGLIFPFYIYPTTAAIQPLITAKQQYPTLQMRVVLNPNSGVGSSKNTDYVNAVTALQKAGISVAGYVATNYSNRSLASVEQEISQWITWYNPNGIFLDEMGVNHPYYQALTAYAKSNGLQFTIGNPGTDIGIAAGQDVDTIIVFENGYLPTIANFQEWAAAGYAPTKIGMISYDVPSLNCSFIPKSKGTFGWIYITDALLPNPYDVYPSYYQEVIDQIAN